MFSNGQYWIIARVSINARWNRLSIRRPWISLTPTDKGSVRAIVPMFTKNSDSIKGPFRAHSDGCLRLSMYGRKLHREGKLFVSARSSSGIFCSTDGAVTVATIQCEEVFFKVLCKHEAQSLARFHHMSAQVGKQFAISCENVQTAFEITGILHWMWFAGCHSQFLQEKAASEEMNLTDFHHILMPFGSGTKLWPS